MDEPGLRLDARFTHLVIVDRTAILVAEDDDGVVLDSPIAIDVLKRIDGQRDAREIAADLGGRHGPEAVHFVLLGLKRSGLVVDVDETPRTGGPGGYGAGSHMRVDDGPERALAERLESAWRSRNDDVVTFVDLAGWAEDRDEWWFRVVVTDDYLRPGFERTVARLARAGPVLPARVGENSVWLGPVIGGGTGACAVCLQTRLRLNLSARAYLHVAGWTESGSRIEIRSLAHEPPSAVFDLLASLAVRVRSDTDRAGAERTLWVHPLNGGSPERHPVRRLPQCPGCGNPHLHPPGARVHLASRTRAIGSSGGFRTVPPLATLQRFEHLISPLTGVVRRIRPVPVEGTDLIHVFTAAHARQSGAPSARAVKANRRDPSGGKGRTALDARVSALCESLERFSGVHQGHEPVRIARSSEIGEKAVPPGDLLLFSDAQYRNRELSNAQDPGGFQWVPERYEDQPIEWSAAYSLGTGRALHVPSALVYLGWSGEGRRYGKGDSNGLAGGNCIEEAILQGFLELVERDAVALWWYNRARRPALDLSTSEDPWVHRLEAWYDGLDRSLWVLDLTTDLALPCFAALSARRTERQQDVIFGFGAHLDAGIALTRALTELGQILPTVLRTREERRRQLLPEFEVAVQWWDTALLADHPYLCPREDAAPLRLDSFAPADAMDLREAIEDCVRRAEDAGCDILVHDLTRPDIDYAVARVLVPGLRHFWRRLAPGRLYDVPPALGWTEGPTAEEDLNPIPMFV